MKIGKRRKGLFDNPVSTPEAALSSGATALEYRSYKTYRTYPPRSNVLWGLARKCRTGPTIYLWVGLLALLLLPITAPAQSPSELVEKGNAAFKEGKYDDALAAYDKAAAADPSEARIDFNRGAAFYRKGEMDKARDAWEKAALGATAPGLEAESLYNLGILEFSKATQLEATDPQAALEAGGRSVRYFYQAREVLAESPGGADQPLNKEASENIEMVRHAMQAIQEALARREELAKNQEAAKQALKELIAKQKDLKEKVETLPEASPQGSQALTELAGEQEHLRDETGKTADLLPHAPASGPPSQTQPMVDPGEQARARLESAQSQQQAASGALGLGKPDEAQKSQEAALLELQAALDLLNTPGDQGQCPGKSKTGENRQGEGQKDQDRQGQSAQQSQENQEPDGGKQGDQASQAREARAGEAEQAGKDGENSEKAEGLMSPDDPEKILAEEKETKKYRVLMETTSGYQDVDKDW